MIQKKHILSIIFFSAVTGAVAQQDAMLSFRPFADMYNNPADLVYCRVWHATSQYRNSLHGFADGPKTYFFSFGGPIGIDKPTSSVTSRHAYTRRKEAQYGLGGYVIKDTYGHFGYTSYMLNYAQRFKLSRDYSFSIGLGAGLFDYFIESNKLNVKEINDPTFNQYVRANDNFLMGDINLGIIIAGQNFHLGFSSRHLIQDRVKLGNTPDFAKLHETYTGFARAKFFVKDNVEMVPSIDGIYTRGIPFHVKINAPFVFHEMFLAGLAFSPLKSFSVETGVYSSGLFFGYAFTLNTSELVSFSDLTHELAIRYVLPITNNAQYKFSITDALF